MAKGQLQAGQASTMDHSLIPCPWIHRLFFYGTMCVFLEVTLDIAIIFYRTHDLKLVGYSSAYSLIFYGLLSMLFERCYVWLKANGFPLPVRSLFYGLVTIVFEVLFGYVLRRCDALPWDYDAYEFQLPQYHIMGVSALEYLPLWGAAFSMGEYVFDMLLKNTVYLPPSDRSVKSHQD